MSDDAGQDRQLAHERASAPLGAADPRAAPGEAGVEPEQADRATVGAGRPEAGVRVAPAFDLHHPPSQELIDDCVHCGFCLPTCPTYLLWGEEMDSPRGRIYLMEIGRQGEPMNDEMVRHFDQCLGCMACVTACPSGVQYGKLIEATRQQVERRHPRSPGTTPATWPTPRASASSHGGRWGPSRAWRSARSPRARSAAARPASTTLTSPN